MSISITSTRVALLLNKAKYLDRINQNRYDQNYVKQYSDHRFIDYVKTECHKMGLGHSSLDQLAEWIVDGGDPNGTDPEDEDHWMNTRPY